ncbi:hypothetical protein PR001_g17356 [Phytophthora rubi]|uniref:Pentacotripeptide-repeat region of PRORP domain-containing protein n=1 Tax=Phytophthora rubi TaxID=129364 RepID=A0A6A3KB43_9STRA|nr:hypothetical protein PR002_g17538 [Phytophthora rubi]KAE9005831.1 hypothetical protein PR001_g17356 [Phytophthora rubi]
MLRSSVRRGVLQRLLQRGLSSSTTPAASQGAHLALEGFIARRESSRALAAFDKLQPAQQSDPDLLQRLALLVVKSGQPHEAPRAAQMLSGLLALPDFAADDATQLAVIYTLDACLQQQRLEDALLLFAAARERDVVVDLPTVEALLRELVAARRMDEAVAIVKSFRAQDDVRPTEQTLKPVLIAGMEQQRFEDVEAMLVHCGTIGVDISPEMAMTIVMVEFEDSPEQDHVGLLKIMYYLEDKLIEDMATRGKPDLS